MDFSEVKNLIDKSMVEYSIPCSDIALVHNGEIVFRYWNGTSDDEKKIPLKPLLWSDIPTRENPP